MALGLRCDITFVFQGMQLIANAQGVLMQLDITENLSAAQRNVDDLANILVGASPRIQFARALIESSPPTILRC